jgi:PAS domain S-box-containing protein
MAGKMPVWNLKGKEDTVQPLKGILNGISTGGAVRSGPREEPIPAYDDLGFLKDSRYIRDLVGESLLSELVEDLACLVDTSVTVCEKNGDCALKFISSNWCRFLNQASRRLCGAADSRKAMASGEGPCFESCRNDAALVSIETKQPVELPCRGGIRIFAVPVFAGDEVVGSLAIGYGDPPRDGEKLRDLAEAYGVPLEELRRQAEACEPRPSLMIELARKRLATTARVIGEIVAQKQVESALRRSEEKFHAVFHLAKDAIYLFDQEERLLDANKAALETLGYSREELMAMRPLDIDISAVAEHDERMKALRRKGYVLFETLTRKRDGTLIPMEVSLQHLELAGSNVVLAVCRDISRRKQAEDALERRIVALTEPLENIGTVAFEDLFNLSDLQRLQDLLAETWGVSALITRPDGTAITKPSSFTRFCSTFIRSTEKGKRKCMISDATLGRYDPSGPVVQTCLSAGLCGAGASITVGGRHIASWLIGQVRNERQDEEKILEYCRELGLDEKEFCEAYRQVPFMPQEKFEQIAHALFALANQLSTTAYQNIQQARFITERKRVEDALRESERKLREAQRIARLGNWELDLITNTLQWSDGTYEIFEIDPDEFDASFEAFLKQIHPDTGRWSNTFLPNAWRTGPPTKSLTGC